MRRRDFITLLGGAVICPFAARAEKNDGVRRVGVIMGFAENDEVWQAYLASFRQGLQEVGWTDGRNIRFDYRFPGDSEERMRAMAEEVVGLRPDVIFVSTNSVVSATLKRRAPFRSSSPGCPIRSEADLWPTCRILAGTSLAFTISSGLSAGSGWLFSNRSHQILAASQLCMFQRSRQTVPY